MRKILSFGVSVYATEFFRIYIKPVPFEELYSLVPLTNRLELEPVHVPVVVICKLPEEVFVLDEEVLEDPKLPDLEDVDTLSPLGDVEGARFHACGSRFWD